MEDKGTNKPKAGAWDNLTTEKKVAVKFETGKANIVTLTCDRPREIPWEGDVFYVFNCLENNEEKVIKTSAWSLLNGLKALEPLNNKTIKITKQMVKGKQSYEVIWLADGTQKPEEINMGGK